MLQLKTMLTKERPRIDRALLEIINDLPEYVRPVAEYAVLSGGKKLRPSLAVFTAYALGCDCEKMSVHRICSTLEMFHVATLLHDDILDNAEIRRNHMATHIKFGTPRTLLAADAMVAQSFKILSETNDPKFMQCLTGAVIGTADGEIAEIAQTGQVKRGLNEYLQIIKGKTASLIRASCELGALCAGADEDILECAREYGENVGIAFQIVDDALDFAPSSDIGKPSCGDLREGKFTPPIAYYYLNNLNENEQNDFAMKFANLSFTESDLTDIASKIIGCGFDAKTRELSDKYLNVARYALDRMRKGFGSSPSALLARGALYEAVDFIRARKS